jgi:hypothetical protein
MSLLRRAAVLLAPAVRREYSVQSALKSSHRRRAPSRGPRSAPPRVGHASTLVFWRLLVQNCRAGQLWDGTSGSRTILLRGEGGRYARFQQRGLTGTRCSSPNGVCALVTCRARSFPVNLRDIAQFLGCGRKGRPRRRLCRRSFESGEWFRFCASIDCKCAGIETDLDRAAARRPSLRFSSISDLTPRSKASDAPQPERPTY